MDSRGDLFNLIAGDLMIELQVGGNFRWLISGHKKIDTGSVGFGKPNIDYFIAWTNCKTLNFCV